MSLELYIAELRGYLKALQHLNGPKYSFGVKHFCFNGDIDSFIKEFNHGLSIVGSNLIEFKEIEKRIYSLVMNGMISQELFPTPKHLNYYKSLLIESVNEYYGLASTAENKEGVFHPLIRGPVYELKLEDKPDLSNFFFLVKIEGYYVLTYLRKK